MVHHWWRDNSQLFTHIHNYAKSRPVYFKPQATKWGHLWPRSHILMCHLLFLIWTIIGMMSLSVYQPYTILHSHTDFHRDPPIDVTYIPQSLVESFMTLTKKLVLTHCWWLFKESMRDCIINSCLNNDGNLFKPKVKSMTDGQNPSGPSYIGFSAIHLSVRSNRPHV